MQEENYNEYNINKTKEETDKFTILNKSPKNRFKINPMVLV